MRMRITSFSNSARRKLGFAIGPLLIVVAVVGIRYLQAEAATYDEADLQRWSTVSGIDVEDWPTSEFFLSWVAGDGQVFAAFAADPIRGGQRVGVSGYRFTRVGYSWMAVAVTFGVDDWVPYGLVFVSTLAIAYVSFVAFSRREEFGPRIGGSWLTRRCTSASWVTQQRLWASPFSCGPLSPGR